MPLAAAVHHSRDRTIIAVEAAGQVGGCIGQNIDVPVSQSVEQIVRSPIPQVVIDIVTERTVDAPVLDFHKRMAENVDFSPDNQGKTRGSDSASASGLQSGTAAPLKEELAEASA